MKKIAQKHQKLPATENFANGKTLLIAAGGTGGHITPGISIAEVWLKAGGKIIFATLQRNFDYPDIVRLARNSESAIVAYDAPRLEKNPLKWFVFVRRFRAALNLIKSAVAHEEVAAVVGMGGYSSFPAVVYALSKRTPLYLCEQNARWGIVTRLFRSRAKAVFLAFAPERPLKAKYVATGNPIRAMFTHIKLNNQKNRSKKSLHNILFIGGSQGATDLNNLYLEFCNRPEAKHYRATVAAGKNGFTELKSKARKGDTILPFIEDMMAAYTVADFIVARAGSGTLFEIAWSQKPALLIPYPHAAADHQRANAEAIQRTIAATIFDERPFPVARAADALIRFLASPPVKPASATVTESSTAAEVKIARYIAQGL